MRVDRVVLVGIVVFGLVTAGAAKKAKKTVELKNVKGENVGTATLSDDGHGVAIGLNLKNLEPGEHAIHIHQNAKCEADPADPQKAFVSAGGHFNPAGKKHGLQNPEGPHNGDMQNITVGADGTVKAKIENPRVTLKENEPNSLFANGGTALVLHQKADDMKTDPAGNAGPRVACGVITK